MAGLQTRRRRFASFARRRGSQRGPAPRLELAQRVPQRARGICGAGDAAALERRYQALADLVDVAAADLLEGRTDQEAVALELLVDFDQPIGNLFRRADDALEPTLRAVFDQLTKRLALTPLREGIERAL